MFATIVGLFCFGLGFLVGLVLGPVVMYKAFEVEINHGYVQLGKGRLFKVVKATIQ